MVPDPYGHDISLNSFKTSVALKFVIIFQKLIKTNHKKVLRVNMTVNLPNWMSWPHRSGTVYTGS